MHTDVQTLSLTQTHTLIVILAYRQIDSFTQTYRLFLSLSHTPTHTDSHTHVYTLIHTVSFTLLQTHTHTLSHTHNLSLSYTHIRTITYTFSNTHSHAHTCRLSHTDCHTHPDTWQGHAQTQSMGTFCLTQARVSMMNVEHRKLFLKKHWYSLENCNATLFFTTWTII